MKNKSLVSALVFLFVVFFSLSLWTITGCSSGGGGGGSDTYAISGTITGASSVTVTLSGAKSATTTTSTTGAYSFTGLSNGSYTLTPTKSGYTFSPATRSVAVSSANVTGQNFTASSTAGYSISGTITGASSVTVTLSGAKSATTTTSTTGAYSFTGLSNGSYTLTPTKSGYTFSPATRSVTVASANVTGQNFTASAVTYSISGNVAGATSVTLTLSGAKSAVTTSDADGDYSFSGLSNGSYTVTPSKSGYTFSPTNKAVTISGANSTGNNFTGSIVTRKYNISGTITWSGFAHNSGYFLTLLSTDPTFQDQSKFVSYEVVSIASGAQSGSRSYSFANLSSATYYVGGVIALSNPFAGGGLSAGDRAGTYSTGIWVEDGGVPTAIYATGSTTNITGKSFSLLSTIEASDDIYGFVNSSLGGTLLGVTMSLSGTRTDVSTTDSNGRYEFSDMPSGSYTVTPTKTNYSFTPASTSFAFDASQGEYQVASFTGSYEGGGPFSFSGTISTTLGAQVSGAAVSITQNFGSFQTIAISTTDASGYYSFVNIPSGSYSFSPIKPGYSFSPQFSNPYNITQNETGKNIYAYPSPYYTLSGTISSSDSTPINGATVRIVQDAGYTSIETTDASGYYSFYAPGSPSGDYYSWYNAYVSAEGYSFYSDRFQFLGNTTKNYSGQYIGPQYTVSGRVTDESGNPVEGASVSVGVNTGGSYYTESTTTNSNGEFSLRNYSGTWFFTVSKSGYVTITPSDTISSDMTGYELRIFRAYSASGWVSFEGGGGLSGVYLSFMGPASTGTTTSGDGFYSISNSLYNGTYTVTPNYLAQSSLYSFTPSSRFVTIEGGDLSDINFTATTNETYNVSGTMTNLSNTSISYTLSSYETGSFMSSGSVSVGPTGGYTAYYISPGHYWFAPQGGGTYTFTPSSQEVLITSSNVVGVDFTVTLPPVYTVSGTVTDSATGLGVSGITIYGYPSAGGSTTMETTDGSGFYSLRVISGTAYTVQPSSMSYSFNPMSLSTGTITGSLEGQNFIATSTGSGTYSIYGNISNFSGSHSGTFHLYNMNTYTSSSCAVTVNDGSYTINGGSYNIVNGQYRITPSFDGYNFTPASQEITISGSDYYNLNFTANAQTYAITGEVRDSQGNPVRDAYISISGDATGTNTSNNDGSYDFYGLSNGSYTLTITKEGYTFSPSSRGITISGSDSPGNDFVALTNTISGTISWTGFTSAEGGVVIFVSTHSDFSDVLQGGPEQVGAITSVDGSLPYSVGRPAGTYYVFALSISGGEMPVVGDIIGEYSDGLGPHLSGEVIESNAYGTPAAIDITSGDATGKDFSLGATITALHLRQ